VIDPAAAKRCVMKKDDIPADILEKAVQVIGNEDNARKWLHSPKRVLNGKTPAEHAQAMEGAEEVRQILGRMEHGVFG
jgi:putative toxin-antitoxin system antitoxin component (TIGR02293 family)